jgi:hypothetical protein
LKNGNLLFKREACFNSRAMSFAALKPRLIYESRITEILIPPVRGFVSIVDFRFLKRRAALVSAVRFFKFF